MIVGLGIDIVEISRVREVWERHGERFVQRVFTVGESAYCMSKRDPAERLAARFAAKEATMKALGTGKSHGVLWRDIEVVNAPGGAPRIELRGMARVRFERLGGRRSMLTISHSGDLAVAQVIFES